MKTALITGASSGIGKALAHEYAQGGYQLVLVARSTEALQQLKAEVEAKHKVTAHVLTQDLSLPEGPAQVFAATERLGLAIDALVNNAGYGDYGLFWQRPAAKTLGMVHLNVTALTALTHLYLPGMVARGRGHVLNVASVAAFVPGPMMSVYYATKHYVLALSEGLARELKGTGVTVTALCPGAVATGFQTEADIHGVRFLKMGKIATPEWVAQVAYRQAHRGRVVVVPGLMNQFFAGMPRYTTRGFLRNFIFGISKRDAA
ncbi:MAG: SDR family oxidoreductase [Bacteroidia bacterium]|nr:SDR family oxidoreductase [Bacteroidia bacterium]